MTWSDRRNSQAEKCFWNMVNFNWEGGKWRYRKNLSPTPVSVPHYKEEQYNISFKHHSNTVKAVVVWKAPDGTQNKQVTVLI